MVKLEHKLEKMNLEEARKYKVGEWVKAGIGGGCIVTGLSAIPGALVLGAGGALVGIIDSPESAAALGTLGMVGGGAITYVMSGVYTAKKIYNAVIAGYRVKDLESGSAKKKKK